MDIETSDVHCHFCGKSRAEVDSLIQGVGAPPPSICNECIFLAADLIIKGQAALRKKNKELRKENLAIQAELHGYREHGIPTSQLETMREEIRLEILGLISSVISPEGSATLPVIAKEESAAHEHQDQTAGGRDEGTAT